MYHSRLKIITVFIFHHTLQIFLLLWRHSYVFCIHAVCKLVLTYVPLQTNVSRIPDIMHNIIIIVFIELQRSMINIIALAWVWRADKIEGEICAKTKEKRKEKRSRWGEVRWGEKETKANPSNKMRLGERIVANNCIFEETYKRKKRYVAFDQHLRPLY